jgi:hypothetical protein
MGLNKSCLATGGNRTSRQSFASEPVNAGIEPDLRQLLAGHSDDRSHAVCTHKHLICFGRRREAS